MPAKILTAVGGKSAWLSSPDGSLVGFQSGDELAAYKKVHPETGSVQVTQAELDALKAVSAHKA